MRRKSFIILTFFLQGCAISAGLGVHSESLDRPEVQGIENPVGIIRGIAQYEKVELFCEHISSIPVREQGHGFNVCGALVRIN